jgi:hypothetical protein
MALIALGRSGLIELTCSLTRSAAFRRGCARRRFPGDFGAGVAPEGFPWPEAPAQEDVFAPDYAPGEIAEIAQALRKDAGFR